MKLKKNVALSDSGFLFNSATGDSYSLNPIGLEFLKLFQEGKSDEEAILNILSNYMIDRATVEKDLYDFRNMLSSYKLIE
jgi:hypothetical protein